LGGEIRPVNRVEARIAEAARLGFTHIYLSAFNNLKGIKKHPIEIVQVNRLDELISLLF